VAEEVEEAVVAAEAMAVTVEAMAVTVEVEEEECATPTREESAPVATAVVSPTTKRLTAFIQPVLP
jgi:hypothetical protein